jgi:hypothetical protein
MGSDLLSVVGKGSPASWRPPPTNSYYGEGGRGRDHDPGHCETSLVDLIVLLVVIILDLIKQGSNDVVLLVIITLLLLPRQVPAWPAPPRGVRGRTPSTWRWKWGPLTVAPPTTARSPPPWRRWGPRQGKRGGLVDLYMISESLEGERCRSRYSSLLCPSPSPTRPPGA